MKTVQNGLRSAYANVLLDPVYMVGELELGDP